jgi:hypothetical protein
MNVSLQNINDDEISIFCMSLKITKNVLRFFVHEVYPGICSEIQSVPFASGWRGTNFL